jgi:hypothetical protein
MDMDAELARLLLKAIEKISPDDVGPIERWNIPEEVKVLLINIRDPQKAPKKRKIQVKLLGLNHLNNSAVVEIHGIDPRFAPGTAVTTSQITSIETLNTIYEIVR